MKNHYIERAASLTAAVILLQTLYFKFSAAPVSVHIFSTLGVEPYGRILTGVLELITGLLLIFRRTSFLGAILGLGIISGAILSHLFILGIEVQNDKGQVFILALVVLFACLVTFFSKLSNAVQNYSNRSFIEKIKITLGEMF